MRATRHLRRRIAGIGDRGLIGRQSDFDIRAKLNAFLEHLTIVIRLLASLGDGFLRLGHDEFLHHDLSMVADALGRRNRIKVVIIALNALVGQARRGKRILVPFGMDAIDALTAEQRIKRRLFRVIMSIQSASVSRLRLEFVVSKVFVVWDISSIPMLRSGQHVIETAAFARLREQTLTRFCGPFRAGQTPRRRQNGSRWVAGFRRPQRLHFLRLQIAPADRVFRHQQRR